MAVLLLKWALPSAKLSKGHLLNFEPTNNINVVTYNFRMIAYSEYIVVYSCTAFNIWYCSMILSEYQCFWLYSVVHEYNYYRNYIADFN